MEVTGPRLDRAYAVVKADADLPHTLNAFYVGTSGDVSIVPAGDTSAAPTPLVLKACPVGLYQIPVRRIAAATAAADIVGFY